MKVIYLSDAKELIKAMDKAVSGLDKRECDTGADNRNSYQRDYARILYSSAFRRLQGKMQVLGVENTAFFRTRLTHSLEVAQIAKGIRGRIDRAVYNKESDISNIYLLDAAALAHDIGHPAFGHKGERVLNELAQSFNLHFEGNAQNYRVLRKLEQKSAEFSGLNLTNRTLLAINKYIVKEGTMNANNKVVDKFMYSEDFDYLEKIRKDNGIQAMRTIDVQIIELADDIAYAVHDLEDALAQGYITLDQLYCDLTRRDNASKKYTKEECCKAAKDFKTIVMGCFTKATNVKDTNSSADFYTIYRKEIVSELTKRFIEDVVVGAITKEEAIEHGTEEGMYELKLNKYAVLCKLLSKKIFKGITSKPHIAIYERRGEIILRTLFKLYTNTQINKNGNLFPPEFRPIILPKEEKADIIKKFAQSALDYLGGMMDTYAIAQYEKYFNVKFCEIPLDGSSDSNVMNNINITVERG